jgi:hypothetical protein
VPLKSRIAFAGVNKFIYSHCDLDDMVKKGVDTIKERMEDLEQKIGNDEKIYFNPSRTAQNGVNFITRDLVEELKTCEDEKIKDLFRLLFILGKEDYTKARNPIVGFFDTLASKNLTFSKPDIYNIR